MNFPRLFQCKKKKGSNETSKWQILKKRKKKDCLSHIVCLTTGCGGVKILHENKKQLHKSRRRGVGYGVCGICISDYQRQRPHPCSKSLRVTSCRGLEEYFEKVFLSMLILINNCYCWIFMLLLSCINERALLEVTDLGRPFLQFYVEYSKNGTGKM